MLVKNMIKVKRLDIVARTLSGLQEDERLPLATKSSGGYKITLRMCKRLNGDTGNVDYWVQCEGNDRALTSGQYRNITADEIITTKENALALFEKLVKKYKMARVE
jgi:hypothetical protein